MMTFSIERIQLPELLGFLFTQEEDTFPERKEEKRLKMLAEKWCEYAEFCTCRGDDGKLVGMIAFYANRPDTRTAFIIRVYVSPLSRRIGIFHKMLHLVQNHIKQSGYTHLRLEVMKNNAIAQKAYLKHGFHYEKDSNSQTYFMQKNL